MLEIAEEVDYQDVRSELGFVEQIMMTSPDPSAASVFAYRSLYGQMRELGIGMVKDKALVGFGLIIGAQLIRAPWLRFLARGGGLFFLAGAGKTIHELTVSEYHYWMNRGAVIARQKTPSLDSESCII
ncbi:hypothetical protein HYS91_01235 [Candidatus Daviesbacteria bacterium]|nr:hypothetical protein [Candidatus Daviesbacteria bacterium]